MTYATRPDMDARYGAEEMGELLAGASISITAVLADADAEIDAALAERYALPLPGAAYPALTDIACDIARARLYDDEAPDRVLGRLSSARKRLRELGSGSRRLVDAAGALAAARSHARVSGAEPLMTRAQLRDA